MLAVFNDIRGKKARREQSIVKGVARLGQDKKVFAGEKDVGGRASYFSDNIMAVARNKKNYIKAEPQGGRWRGGARLGPPAGGRSMVRAGPIMANNLGGGMEW
ncbi:hypothetical protein V6C27_12080 [Peptococcaceae bacterium 1198_IL3148]